MKPAGTARTQDTLTSEVAHQLRHPLSLILLWEQIARSSQSDAARASALDAIRKAALEQSELIDRLSGRQR